MQCCVVMNSFIFITLFIAFRLSQSSSAIRNRHFYRPHIQSALTSYRASLQEEPARYSSCTHQTSHVNYESPCKHSSPY